MNKKHRIVSKNKRMRSKSRNKTNRRVRRKSMQSRKTLNNRRRKIYKRKTYKRKTYKRKTYKRKTKKNYRMVGGAYEYDKDNFTGIKVDDFEGLKKWLNENKDNLSITKAQFESKKGKRVFLKYDFYVEAGDFDDDFAKFSVVSLIKTGDKYELHGSIIGLEESDKEEEDKKINKRNISDLNSAKLISDSLLVDFVQSDKLKHGHL